MEPVEIDGPPTTQRQPVALWQERLGENVKWEKQAAKLCVHPVRNTSPYGPEIDGRVLKG